MSDDTTQAVRDAEAALDAKRAKAGELRKSCLQAIAADIPARLDALAKKQLDQQRGIAIELGRAEIQALRADLDAEAKATAAYVLTLDGLIEWPEARPNSFEEIRSRHVALAVNQKVQPRLDKAAQVLVARGFGGHPRGYMNQDIFQAQDSYDFEALSAVASALDEVAEARKSLYAAQQRHQAATVEDLWDR